LLAFVVFLLLDDILELFLAYWSSSCAYPALGVRSLVFCCPSARFTFYLKDLPLFLGFDFPDCEWIVAGES
jgi:hypothetical protein